MRIAAVLACGALAVGLADCPASAGADPAAPAISGVAASAATLPSDPKGLVAFVTAALQRHDREAMERLVNWDGVRPLRKRMTLFQISTSYGRPIKEAVVEDFDPDGLTEAQSQGLKPNMPVLKTLRIIFDEQPDEAGLRPANVFLIGEKDGAFRIAVVNSSGPQRK